MPAMRSCRHAPGRGRTLILVGPTQESEDQSLADPEIKEKLAQTGYVAGGSSPEELEKLLKSEIAKWSAVIKSVGIKID